MITGLIGWWVAGRWVAGLVVDGRLFDILFVLGNENDNIDDDSTVKDIFAVKDTKFMSLLLLYQQKTIKNY